MGVSYELRPEGAVQLSRGDARARTDELKSDAERLWLKLVELYNGGAHKALGYRSWRAYCAAEFQMDRNAAHRLLAAGQVMDDLWSGTRAGTTSPNGRQRPELPTSERVARELRPVHAEEGPKAVRETWEQVVEEFGPKPTAAQTREVVQRNGEPKPTAAPEPPAPWSSRVRTLIDELEDILNLGAEPERVRFAIGLMGGLCGELEPLAKEEAF